MGHTGGSSLKLRMGTVLGAAALWWAGAAAAAPEAARVPVRHRAASEVLSILKEGNLVPPGLVSLQAVTVENVLLATGTPQAVKELAEVVRTYLDVPVRRVRLSFSVYVFQAGASADGLTETNMDDRGVTRLGTAGVEKLLASLGKQEARYQVKRVLDTDLSMATSTPARVGLSPQGEDALQRMDVEASARVNRDDSVTVALLWKDLEGLAAPGTETAPVGAPVPGSIGGAAEWRLRRGDRLAWLVRAPTATRKGALLLAAATPLPR